MQVISTTSSCACAASRTVPATSWLLSSSITTGCLTGQAIPTPAITSVSNYWPKNIINPDWDLSFYAGSTCSTNQFPYPLSGARALWGTTTYPECQTLQQATSYGNMFSASIHDERLCIQLFTEPSCPYTSNAYSLCGPTSGCFADRSIQAWRVVKPEATTTAANSGTTHGVYIAYQTVYEPIAQPPGMPPQTATQYFDEVWSDWWQDGSALQQDWCNDDHASGQDLDHPRTNSPPYPTKSFSRIPVGSQNPTPTCNWIPDQSPGGPGHLSCANSPTSVSCQTATVGPVSCYNYPVVASVTPLVQCVWPEN